LFSENPGISILGRIAQEPVLAKKKSPASEAGVKGLFFFGSRGKTFLVEKRLGLTQALERQV
jgi:hypothetical protein